MNREILFKAKRIDNGEWEIGSLILLPNGDCEIANRCINPPDSDPMWKKVVITHNVDKDTICQYTGLTDKNGNKIWENDVVKKHFYTDYDAYANSEKYIGKVEYLDCAWHITFFDENNNKCIYPMFMAIEFKDAEYYEVLGNIFDNPELVGGAE